VEEMFRDERRSKRVGRRTLITRASETVPPLGVFGVCCPPSCVLRPVFGVLGAEVEDKVEDGDGLGLMEEMSAAKAPLPAGAVEGVVPLLLLLEVDVGVDVCVGVGVDVGVDVDEGAAEGLLAALPTCPKL